MKIRDGFVSNSSSSSFIIKGKLNKRGKLEVDPKMFGEVSKDGNKVKISGSIDWSGTEDFEQMIKQSGLDFDWDED